MTKTGILLSGGMDSIALAYWKKPAIAFTIDYGQKPAKAEIQAAKTICDELGIQQEIIQVDCTDLGSGDLAGTDPIEEAPSIEWWPFRNQLLITLASMKAITYKIQKILIGSVKSDSSHADGTIEFISAIDSLLEIQEGHLRIDAPAINLSTHELVKKSNIPISLLSWSHSCHTGNVACGRCRGCNKHREAMIELGYENY